MDVINVVWTALLSAAALFAIAKLMGHKQMAQLDFFDYITGITVGSIAAELATELEEPWKPLIAIVVYGVIEVGLSTVTRKLPRMRKFVNGTPTILMNNGVLYRKNLKKAKLELSEFMMMCRQEGYFNLNDIQTAIFEYNGRLTVLPVSDKRPLNPKDVNIMPETETICTEVIMDGRILEENLSRMGLNAKWLQKQIEAQGYKEAKEVFLGICDDKKKVTLYAGE